MWRLVGLHPDQYAVAQCYYAYKWGWRMQYHRFPLFLTSVTLVVGPSEWQAGWPLSLTLCGFQIIPLCPNMLMPKPTAQCCSTK